MAGVIHTRTCWFGLSHTFQFNPLCIHLAKSKPHNNTQTATRQHTKKAKTQNILLENAGIILDNSWVILQEALEQMNDTMPFQTVRHLDAPCGVANTEEYTMVTFAPLAFCRSLACQDVNDVVSPSGSINLDRGHICALPR